MNADLHAAVVAELDRLERLYGGDRKDGRHAALMAAVLRHQPRPITFSPKPMYDTPYCKGCNGYWTSGVCAELRAIAGALGVEVAA